MNIMMIAVKDRTARDGVRKALGATTREIQRQFFSRDFFLTMGAVWRGAGGHGWCWR